MRNHPHSARPRAILVSTFAAVVLLAGCASSPEPIEYHPAYLDFPTVKDLQAGSTDVVQAVVVDSRSEWIDVSSTPSDPNDPDLNPQLGTDTKQPNSEFLYTVYSVKVTDVADGESKAGDMLEVRQLGGTVDDEKATADGAANLSKGNEYIFFLVTMPDGMAELPNPAQSVFAVTSDGTVTTPENNPLGPGAAADAAALFAVMP